MRSLQALSYYFGEEHRGSFATLDIVVSNTMTDAIELLSTRKSVKAVELKAPGPSAGEVDKLLTIACRVPDHGKLTPWRFIVFEGDARIAAGAAIVAVVSRAAPHGKIPEWEQVLSAGAAAMNLVLAAHALGYGANWITGWYAYDRGVLDALGLASHERIAGFIHIGTSSGSAQDRPRPPLSEIATRFSA